MRGRIEIDHLQLAELTVSVWPKATLHARFPKWSFKTLQPRKLTSERADPVVQRNQMFMLGHVSISVVSIDPAQIFYDAVMNALGVDRLIVELLAERVAT